LNGYLWKLVLFGVNRKFKMATTAEMNFSIRPDPMEKQIIHFVRNCNLD
jgi:hypothetical protein